MSTVPIPVAINLAYWLYRVHPQVFTELLNTAKGRPSGLGSLGDDGSDFLPGVSVMPDDTSYDVGDFVTSDAGSISTSDISATLTPDLVSLPAPALTPTTGEFYTGITPMPAADTTADVGNFLANSGVTGSTTTGSTASTVNPATASNVGSVAAVLTAGLGALAAVTTAIYKAGTAPAATIATQANRAAAGVNPAPITYAYNSAGQLVPVLSSASTGTVGALTPQTLASLGIPSAWGPYIVPGLIGVIVLVALSGASKK